MRTKKRHCNNYVILRYIAKSEIILRCFHLLREDTGKLHILYFEKTHTLIIASVESNIREIFLNANLNNDL